MPALVARTRDPTRRQDFEVVVILTLPSAGRFTPACDKMLVVDLAELTDNDNFEDDCQVVQLPAASRTRKRTDEAERVLIAEDPTETPKSEAGTVTFVA